MKFILIRIIILLKMFLFLITPVACSVFLFIFYDFKFKLTIEANIDNIIIYDHQKNKIKYFEDKVEFQKLPKNLVHAFIAIEDTTFFKHYGFSAKSIFRSFWKNIKEKKIVQGGSTITEQYVKLYYGDLRKNFRRKIKNLLIAILVEFYYSKEEIFEAYCNKLYFGGNVYGLASASRIFFNKNYKDLTLSESALIAGIVQRPEYLNPIKNYVEAIKKRNLVLKRMKEERYINQKEYKASLKIEPTIFKNNYFDAQKSIIQSTEEYLKNLDISMQYEYDIYTTINNEIQLLSNKLFNNHLHSLKKKINTIEGAVIITEYKTGKIVSIINGYNLLSKKTIFNWKRQIGSIIKPFITYFAFLNGDLKTTSYFDTPLEKHFLWNPQNNNKKFRGETTLEKALINSNNIVPIRILDKFKIENFIPLVQPFFKEKIKPYLSLALGCLEATPYEIINLFNSLLAEGFKNDPFFIEKIIKKSGGTIYERKKNKKKIFYDDEALNNTKSILEEIGSSLSKKYFFNFKDKIYAKTGTTNDAVSCWFICANDKYSIAAVIGSDLNEKLSNYGLTSTQSVAPLALNILHQIEQLENQ